MSRLSWSPHFFDGDVLPVDSDDGHIAIIDVFLFFDDDDIARADVGLHAVTLDAEGIIQIGGIPSGILP